MKIKVYGISEHVLIVTMSPGHAPSFAVQTVHPHFSTPRINKQMARIIWAAYAEA
jgi:hypothetical protein